MQKSSIYSTQTREKQSREMCSTTHQLHCASPRFFHCQLQLSAQFTDIDTILAIEVNWRTRIILILVLGRRWRSSGSLPGYAEKGSGGRFLTSASVESTDRSTGVFPRPIPGGREHGLVGRWTTSLQKNILDRIVSRCTNGGPTRLCGWPKC